MMRRYLNSHDWDLLPPHKGTETRTISGGFDGCDPAPVSGTTSDNDSGGVLTDEP
jgi:hypothetical protein